MAGGAQFAAYSTGEKRINYKVAVYMQCGSDTGLMSVIRMSQFCFRLRCLITLRLNIIQTVCKTVAQG